MIDPMDKDKTLQALNDGGFYTDKGKWFSLIKNRDKLYRKRVETIVIKNGKEIFVKKKPNNEYSLPGGSCEKDVPDYTQAAKECEEEAHFTISNIESSGISYIRKYPMDQYFRDICEDFKGKTGYDGALTYIYVATYEGKFTGAIEKEDEDPFIRSGRWYPISDCLKFFSKDHREALMWYLKNITINDNPEEEITESYVSNYFRNKKLLKKVAGAPEVGREACDQVLAGLKKAYSKLLNTSAIKREKNSKDLACTFHPVFTFEFADGNSICIALNFDDSSFTPGAATHSEKYGDLVIIFPNFFDEDLASQRMILLHEIGHIRLGHLEWKHASKTLFTRQDKYEQNRTKAMLKGKVIYPEYNADLYAMLNGANLYSILGMHINKDKDGYGDYRFTNQEIANRYDIVWKRYQKLRPYDESRVSSYDTACMAVYEMVYDNDRTKDLSASDKKKLYQILYEFCINKKLKESGYDKESVTSDSDAKEIFEKFYKESGKISYNKNDTAATIATEKAAYKRDFLIESRIMLDKLLLNSYIKESNNDKKTNYIRLLSTL